MNIEEFDLAAKEGLVSCVERGSLALYCYTARCAHERLWTRITKAARGIIFDRATGRVVARPFEKFFNLGEMPETQPEALPADGFTVEEKLDGSLGIIFHHEGRWDIATKGAFGSEQAEYARAELLPRYPLDDVPIGFTLCTEILYPENRIVIDYQGRRELVLLSAFHTAGGGEVPRLRRDRLSALCKMPVIAEYPHRNLLNLPFTDDSEGYVVRFSDGHRVKVKSPQYVKIHRLLEYCSPRRILDMIADGSYDETRAQIPDDIAGDFDDVSATLRMSLRQVKDEAQQVFQKVAAVVGPMPGQPRKEFALAAKELASARALPLVFALLDGKDVDAVAIRAVRRELSARIAESEVAT